jgi:hypothetical protein
LTTLAPELVPALKLQIERVKLLLEENLLYRQYAGFYMPDALVGIGSRYKNVSRAVGACRCEAYRKIYTEVLKHGAFGARRPLSDHNLSD